jgi:hypothetical protein
MHIETDTDAYYLVTALPDANQANSLAAYLTGHGLTAVAEANEVTVLLEEAAGAAVIYQLRKTWALYWKHSDSEIYGLPVFQKTAPCSCDL